MFQEITMTSKYHIIISCYFCWNFTSLW